jgi:Domain of unknown function (DUF4124)
MFDRRRGSVLTMVAVLLSAGTLQAAEIYKYRDPQTGRLVISNQPPPAGTGAVTAAPSVGRQENIREAPPVHLPTAAPDTAPVLARRGPLTEGEWRWLEKGRVDYEVIAYLGEPTERRPQQTFEQRGTAIQREIWVYPGDDVTPTVLVWMVEGRVKHAERQVTR